MHGHSFLIHGAWHGGDVWQPLLKELQNVEKQASAVTLTWLGERKHLLSDIVFSQHRTQFPVIYIIILWSMVTGAQVTFRKIDYYINGEAILERTYFTLSPRLA